MALADGTTEARPAALAGGEVGCAAGSLGLSLAGELDLDRSEELEACLAVAARAPGDVVLDLGAVTFADSTALGMLVRMAAVVGRRGCRVVVRHAHPRVARVLVLAGLDEVVSLADA